MPDFAPLRASFAQLITVCLGLWHSLGLQEMCVGRWPGPLSHLSHLFLTLALLSIFNVHIKILNGCSRS